MSDAAVRVVQDNYTEVFEGRFVDKVRFESNKGNFEVVLHNGFWVIRSIESVSLTHADEGQ